MGGLLLPVVGRLGLLGIRLLGQEGLLLWVKNLLGLLGRSCLLWLL